MELLKTALTALLSVIALFIIDKILGHKQVSQLDFFDYITGITIGSIAAELATELEKPLKPLIAMSVYGIVAVSLSILTSKMPRIRKFVNGTPTIIINNGKIYRENMKKAKLDLSELTVMCRQEGYFDLNEIQTAVFEYNGRLTVLPKSQNRPATPEDMGIATEDAQICTEIIMDGRILEDNLRRLGLDRTWLKRQLEKQHHRNEKDIFLATYDGKALSVFEAK